MLLLFMGLIALVIIVGAIFVNTSPQFGASATEADLVRYQRSSNYGNNGAFKNMEPTRQSTGFKLSTIPKFFMKGVNMRPETELSQQMLTGAAFESKHEGPRITWFGHSAVLLEMNDLNIFIDPMLGEVPAPHPFLGNSRFNATLPLAIDELPYIDVVLITHDHYDHLDYGSIQKIKSRVGRYFVPLGIKAHLVSWGIDEGAITEFDWWEETQFNSVQFVATPARHFSGRSFKRNQTLWCSWVIKTDDHAVFFSGDSGYGSHFKQIGEQYGPFEFAMMECGQYNEQWAHVHMMPEETVQASIDLNASLMMPIHWGAFKLALHEWTDPIERVTAAAKNMNVNIATPRIGEFIILNEENYPNSTWWKNR